MFRNFELPLFLVAGLFVTSSVYAQANEAVDSTARGGVVALADRVSALESLVGQLQTELASAQTTIGTLNSELATTQSRVGLLETQLAAADGRISTLETGLNTAQNSSFFLRNDITQIDARLSKTESVIGALEDNDNTQNGTLAQLLIDVTDAQLLSLRTETRSSSSVTNRFNLRDPLFKFLVDNSATITAVDQSLIAIEEFRCRFSLALCTDPAIIPVEHLLSAEDIATLENTVSGWETDLRGLKSLAQLGTFQITDDQALGILSNIEEDVINQTDLTQLAQLHQQNSLQKMQHTMQVLADLMKAVHDAQMSMIRKIG